MSRAVTIQSVSPRLLAAVRRTVHIGQIGNTWRPALDQVWAFLKQNPGSRTDGHNIFLYHHPAERNAPMDIDFGVEVVRRFEASGEVHVVETPAGKAASALHVGPYQRLKETHDAIHAWVAANHLKIGGHSWEIYGEPVEDESKLETRVEYLLQR